MFSEPFAYKLRYLAVDLVWSAKVVITNQTRKNQFDHLGLP